MARVCEITGKKTSNWEQQKSLDESNKKESFTQICFIKIIKDPETGLVYRIRVSAKGLRTLRKNGIV